MYYIRIVYNKKHMQYSLPDGRVVSMDLETFLAYPDNISQILLSDSEGEFINNPFHGSAIRKRMIEYDEADLASLQVDEIDPTVKLDEIKDDYFPDA